MNKEKFYPVSISFACNDFNGNFIGVPSAIEIGEQLLRLDNSYWNPRNPKIDIVIDKTVEIGGFGASKVKGFVKISRRKFPIVGYKPYWGNIIWDCVIVDVPTAQKVVSYLQTLKCFSIDEADTNWWDKFSADKPFEWTEVEIGDLKKYGYQKP